jgi:pimeloyl-ACP methyl ester carboxylesterase
MMKDERQNGLIRRWSFRALAIVLLAMGDGCVTQYPVNPSFPVSPAQGQQIISADTANPKPLKRPLVIVGGFFDPGISQFLMCRDFRNYLHTDRVIGVTLGMSWSTEDFRQRIITAVDQAFPTTDPVNTTEVDVIGYSMGGLAARRPALHDRQPTPWSAVGPTGFFQRGDPPGTNAARVGVSRFDQQLRRSRHPVSSLCVRLPGRSRGGSRQRRPAGANRVVGFTPHVTQFARLGVSRSAHPGGYSLQTSR